MKKLRLLKTSLVLVVLLSLNSCSKSDDDDNGNGSPGPNSRNVKFEITGNFSGTLTASYVTASGGGTNEQITTALPWVKEITYVATVPSTGITVYGTGGTAGQTITLKVSSGGTQVSSTPTTTGGDGTFVVTAPSYVFP